MIYKKLIRPWLFEKDSEEIHDNVLRIGGKIAAIPGLHQILKASLTVRDKRLEQKLFRMTFPNPVGLAAGMDKGGTALPLWKALSLGFIEMGGITANRQEGNPKPRLFRDPEDEALVNRMGFNNPGAEATACHLSEIELPNVPLGINIGKSMSVAVDNMDAVIADYGFTFRRLYEYGDFFVLNVSSPNTPNLRQLQGKEFLKVLLEGIIEQRLELAREYEGPVCPVLLKIAPDLSEQELDEILEVAEHRVDGIVAVNTTLKPVGLKTTGAVRDEKGGWSGKPLQNQALQVVSYIHRRLPRLPIIGVGGIFSGEDAYRMVCAGASLIQIYTGLVYEGPCLPWRINKELLKLMKREGISSISEINGQTHHI